LALGAQPGDIVRMVVASGAPAVTTGAIAGLTGAMQMQIARLRRGSYRWLSLSLWGKSCSSRGSVEVSTNGSLLPSAEVAHRRREVVHFNVNEHPAAERTSRQLVEAFADRDAPWYPIRDRDRVYGSAVRRQLESLGVDEVLTAPRNPWQNAYAERWIGLIRRECLNHIIVLNARHLKRTLAAYFRCYHESHPHLALEKQCPIERRVMRHGAIFEIAQLGGPRHRYERVAA
jgi:hypothetical protein